MLVKEEMEVGLVKHSYDPSTREAWGSLEQRRQFAGVIPEDQQYRGDNMGSKWRVCRGCLELREKPN
jgi:hypothetical protein